MAFAEVFPQKVVPIRSVVLRVRLDSGLAVLQGENLKRKLFRRLRFFEPNPEDIHLVGFEKCYELYFVVGGKYSLVYFKKHSYNMEGAEVNQDLSVKNKRSTVSPSESDNSSTVIGDLRDEEPVHYSREAYFILDRFRREISLATFPFAPYEFKKENPKGSDISHEDFDCSAEADIEFIREKIAKRPADVADIAKEVFEITERMIVRCPVYNLAFQDVKTGKNITLQINGVSGKKTLFRHDKSNRPDSSDKLIESDFAYTPRKERNNYRNKPERSVNRRRPDKSIRQTRQCSEPEIGRDSDSTSAEKETLIGFPAKVKGEIFTVGDNVTVVVGDLEIPPRSKVNELLVVKGTLRIANNCRMSKKLKALGDIIVGSGTVIEAGMVSGGNIVISPRSVIHGAIKAKGIIKFRASADFEKEPTQDQVVEEEPYGHQFIIASEEDQIEESWKP